ncbi:MAG: nucleotidyltransferase family protein [Deltaproteobacteria bacterium]|nr:nucleotidyltransferase family protein [Deltaproteobacteria bacterium]
MNNNSTRLSFTGKAAEIKLLLYCARPELDGEGIEQIRPLAMNSVDWDYLLQTALQHRVMPLVYVNLKKICPLALPDAAMARFRKAFLTNAAHNLLFTEELFKLLDVLHGHDILAVPIKGPALAEAIYGSIALRQFVDLDILVHRQQALAVMALLSSTGYLSEVPLDEVQLERYIRREYSLAMTKNKNTRSPIVEIHWEMTGRYSSFPFDLHFLKNRLVNAELEGRKILQPAAEELLVYLCMHAAKNCWDSLDSICCISGLIHRRPSLDWQRITLLAEKMRCERILLLNLFLASTLLNASLPEHIQEKAIKDLSIKKIALDVVRNLFCENDVPSRSAVSSDFSTIHFKVRDKFTEKIRYVLFLLFCSTREDWRAFPLQARFSSLHFLLRPIRLFLILLTNMFGRYFSNEREAFAGDKYVD